MYTALPHSEIVLAVDWLLATAESHFETTQLSVLRCGAKGVFAEHTQTW